MHPLENELNLWHLKQFYMLDISITGLTLHSFSSHACGVCSQHMPVSVVCPSEQLECLVPSRLLGTYDILLSNGLP